MSEITLVDQIFKQYYSCRITFAEADIIDKPVAPPAFHVARGGRDVCPLSGGHFIMETNAEHDALLNSVLNNKPRQTGVAKIDAESASNRFQRRITINDMVEIFHMQERLYVSDWKDITKINSALNNYIGEIEHKKSYQLAYQPPPEEDIIKMRALLGSFQKVISILEASGTISDDWGSIWDVFESTPEFGSGIEIRGDRHEYSDDAKEYRF